MAYSIDDILWGVGATSGAPNGGVWAKLAGRTDLLSKGIYGWATDVILNLSRNFRFENLERTGPVLYFQQGVYSYSKNLFINPAETSKVVNLTPSLWRYFNPYVPGATTNTGNVLLWKTVDALEMMFNTPGIPAYFTRFQGNFLVAPIPDRSYAAYLRYQVEHPFAGSDIGKPQAVGTDLYQLNNEWKVITEYAIAEQGATVLRMLDYAQNFHSILYGDPEFERNSEGRGNPGLIYRMVSQMESDSTSMNRAIRPIVSVP